MKLSRIPFLLAIGAISLTLGACATDKQVENQDTWRVGGFKQHHPQTGTSGLSSTGTQCYFCNGSVDQMEGDGDNDGVLDSKDKCPKTPANVTVDMNGCALDSDGDGVVDFRDDCPDTPKGDKVNLLGCSLDTDRDGVSDSKDQCPTTPKGVKVDSMGCALDSDNDGVMNSDDNCPNTPQGANVNSLGCWVLENLQFDTGKSTIKSSSYAMLDKVAGVLNNVSNLEVEIQGHTDNRGSQRFNASLSQKRADAVLNYLVNRGVSANRLSAKGYGFSRPIDSNDTPEGRAINRRVELQPTQH